jgi:hypothetical protein
MASMLGSSSSSSAAEHFYKPEIEVASLEHFQKILDSVDLDLTEFSEDMSYSGFDKVKMAKLAAKQLGAFLTVKLCLLGGMRGTNLGKILDKSRKIDEDIKKAWENDRILSQGSGSNDLTMGRLMATFPEIVAHYLNKHMIPKKLSDDTCPAALQFPAAAGLPMNHTVRLQHLEFTVRFSFLISQDKKFHFQYYRAAFNGQQEVKRLSTEVQKICGGPTTVESKSFDLDAAVAALAAKYGDDRIIMTNQATMPVSKKGKQVAL